MRPNEKAPVAREHDRGRNLGSLGSHPMSKRNTPEGPVNAGGPRRPAYARFLRFLLTISIIGLAKIRLRLTTGRGPRS